jgi:hypothetical protein
MLVKPGKTTRSRIGIASSKLCASTDRTTAPSGRPTAAAAWPCQDSRRSCACRRTSRVSSSGVTAASEQRHGGRVHLGQFHVAHALLAGVVGLVLRLHGESVTEPEVGGFAERFIISAMRVADIRSSLSFTIWPSLRW